MVLSIFVSLIAVKSDLDFCGMDSEISLTMNRRTFPNGGANVP